MQQNAISELEGLSHLTQLRTLVLNHNLIASLSPGLAGLTQLHDLDVSHNCLESLDGLQGLTQLRSLNVSHNRLRTAAQLAPMAGISCLSSLDLADCRLQAEEGQAVVDLLAGLPNLALLRLQGAAAG